MKYLHILVLAGHGFYKDRCQQRASALTFYSLLSLVPMAAMIFGIAKGFGLEKYIENQILQMAEKGNWQMDVVNQVIAFSHRLLENTKGGLIAGVGVVFLFWAVISILGNVESAFNDIWKVRKARTLVRKFTDYTAMMVSAPILFVISSSVTVLVSGQVKLIVQKIALLGAVGPLLFFLLNFFPYVTIWALLSLNYLLMPNTRVPIRSGILAGVVTGTIYQIVQMIYIKFQIGVSNYGAIYGSFAALPLFLVWLQLSWMIVLFGAEIAYANEHFETFGFHPDYSRLNIQSRKFVMLKVLHLLVKNFFKGEKPLSASRISQTLEIPLPLVRQFLFELTSAGLVVETARDKKNEVTFQPGRDIEAITVKYALDAYEQVGSPALSGTSSEEEEALSRSLKSISEAIEKTPGNVGLKKI
jgi:membrane protein